MSLHDQGYAHYQCSGLSVPVTTWVGATFTRISDSGGWWGYDNNNPSDHSRIFAHVSGWYHFNWQAVWADGSHTDKTKYWAMEGGIDSFPTGDNLSVDFEIWRPIYNGVDNIGNPRLPVIADSMCTYCPKQAIGIFADFNIQFRHTYTALTTTINFDLYIRKLA